MSGVECNGTEHDIMQCNFDPTGGVNCDHRRDAGVICDCKFPTLLENLPSEVCDLVRRKWSLRPKGLLRGLALCIQHVLSIKQLRR